MADTNTVEKIDEQIEVKLPSMYKVILHNDDVTTFDFVINVLISIFHKTVEEAIEITMSIHANGLGIAGSPYTREIAEEKTNEVTLYSRANSFPLTATFEEI